MFGTADGKGSVPLLKPLVVLDGVSEISVCFGGRFFDELEGASLSFGDGGRIAVLGHMRDDNFTKTFGEIEPMVIRRHDARVFFVLFV